VSGKYLLDTNVAVAVLNGTLDLAAHRTAGAELYLNATVVGELCFGAEKSERVEQNLAAIDQLIARCPVIPCDESTARHYARLRNRLRGQGRPIPENDLWIAASSSEHGLVLVTRDEHFDQVEGLLVERW
jgi:tRNA(fMet)-specific endonuclease VapC